MTKRILTFLITLMFSVSLLTFSANAVVMDTEDTEYELPTELLSRLGIIDLDDGYFYPAMGITKAEFLVMLFKTVGILANEEVKEGQELFYDVPYDASYAPYVAVAYKLGITQGNGDGFFGANKIITRQQAISMIIRSLKYDSMAESKGGYPGGYETVALSIGITKGIGVSAAGELTKALAAKMLYNTLFTYAIEFSLSDNEAVYSVNNGKNQKTL